MFCSSFISDIYFDILFKYYFEVYFFFRFYVLPYQVVLQFPQSVRKFLILIQDRKLILNYCLYVLIFAENDFLTQKESLISCLNIKFYLTCFDLVDTWMVDIRDLKNPLIRQFHYFPMMLNGKAKLNIENGADEKYNSIFFSGIMLQQEKTVD